MSSSDSAYNTVIRSSLKLKGSQLSEVGTKTRKRRKTEQEEEIEALKALARQKEEEEQALAKAATIAATPAERSVRLAREKRTKDRVKEAIQYTHRQRMDRFNLHLGSLSEHFDIPKVGPG
uniref:Uncharacterized protein n=1 Tax=Noctiluca scintillans TaxID=2966 RepID=A0A7S1F8D1_NOCSC|mmetsp:Transcript_39880/g.105793  ORF Transcript_39880/g.105793 Transcript_39880/m.105793 type:complete len:121 (+) Transcript_39880:73-435(+)